MSRVNGDERAMEPPAGDPSADGESTARAAEELAGQLAVWVARAVSRAREETEDVWAEAQELRRRW
jgi:hypothetical protein